MKRFSLFVLGLAALIPAAPRLRAESASALEYDFEGTDAPIAWEFGNGPEFPGARGDLSIGNDPLAEGANRCLALRFDFSGGGHYVQASVPLPPDLDPEVARLRVLKPFRNPLTFRVVDAGGETFQKTISFHSPRWQNLRVDLLSGWGFSYGGEEGDGAKDRVDRPLRSFSVLVDWDRFGGGPKRGVVRIDDVRFLRTGGKAMKEVVGRSKIRYRTTAFRRPEEGWHLVAEGDAGGSFWKDGELHYDFSAGARAVGIRSWAMALFGEPERMELSLSSDGSGHAVRVRMASHFQTFERVIGRLPRGKGTLASPLGDMKQWEHHGGQNDGIVRPPLRPTEILIVRDPDGPERGIVRFEAFDTVGRVAESEQVVVNPRAVLADGKAVCRVSFCDLRPEGGELLLTVRTRDWEGREIDGQERSVRSPGGGAWRDAEFRFDESSRRFVRFEVEARSPEGIRMGRSETTAVVLPAEERSREPDPASPVGVGLYLYRFPANDQGYAMMDRLAGLARNAGVKWSREEFNWNRIEPERGRRDWSFYDRLVEIENSHGIEIYGLLCYWTGWTASYTPEGIEQYCDFVREAVTRYRDRIRHWEIWNEPNIFFWSGPREMYAELLKAAYRTVKEANPDALVLGCSTSGIDRKFIRQVIDAGAPFDVLTIHPYRGILEDGRYILDLREVRADVMLPDGTERPVWITEMGWPSQIGGTTERNQAALLARVYLGAFASRAGESVSWYDFREDGPNPFYNEHHFGIVRHDRPDPKPAYLALAELTRRIDPKIPPEEIFGPGGDVLAYRFRKRERPVLVLWAEKENHAVRIRKTAGGVRIANLMGEETVVDGSRGGVLLGLESEFPVFIDGPGLTDESLPELLPIEIAVDPEPMRPGGRYEAVVRIGEGIPVEGAEWWLLDGVSGAIEPVESGDDAPPGCRIRVAVDPEAGRGELHLAVLVKTPFGNIRFSRRIPVLPETLRL